MKKLHDRASYRSVFSLSAFFKASFDFCIWVVHARQQAPQHGYVLMTYSWHRAGSIPSASPHQTKVPLPLLDLLEIIPVEAALEQFLEADLAPSMWKVHMESLYQICTHLQTCPSSCDCWEGHTFAAFLGTQCLLCPQLNHTYQPTDTLTSPGLCPITNLCYTQLRWHSYSWRLGVR